MIAHHSEHVKKHKGRLLMNWAYGLDNQGLQESL